MHYKFLTWTAWRQVHSNVAFLPTSDRPWLFHLLAAIVEFGIGDESVLHTEARAHYFDLAVFARGARIPRNALRCLWGGAGISEVTVDGIIDLLLGVYWLFAIPSHSHQIAACCTQTKSVKSFGSMIYCLNLYVQKLRKKQGNFSNYMHS